MYSTEVYNLLKESAKSSREYAARITAEAASLQVEARKRDEIAAYHTSLARQYESLAAQVDQANLVSGRASPVTKI